MAQKKNYEPKPIKVEAEVIEEPKVIVEEKPIKKIEKAPAKFVRALCLVNIRKSPTADAPSVAIASKGEVFEVIGEEGEFYKFKIGYSKKRFYE